MTKTSISGLETDALAWILGGPDSADFVARDFGRSWVHARCGDASRFGELLSLGQLDEALGTYGIRHPAVRLVRADADVPVAEYLWRDQMVDPAQVARLFAEGATVIFGALQDRHEGLRRLCSALARQASARTQTNIYLTPRESQGFKPHWDTHDVFVLQVEGSKLWRMYDGGPELPLKDQKFDPQQNEPGAVEAEFTLSAGEVLYIPRGVMHAAVTTDAYSLHVTLGLLSYTWADLLVDCVSELAERDPEWRAQVPFGIARRDPNGREARETLRDMLESLGREADLKTVLAERQRSFEGHLRPRTTDLLRQAVRSPDLCEEDRVEWRAEGEARLERRDGRVALVGHQREIDFPARAATTIEALMGSEACRAGSLDDGLDWESRRVVLTTLIREGFAGVEEREGTE